MVPDAAGDDVARVEAVVLGSVGGGAVGGGVGATVLVVVAGSIDGDRTGVMQGGRRCSASVGSAASP